ncbi:MAG TPA: lipocalin family protein [Candidatus Paceibacterota bacterium]|nr:lipocalin family protein [Verrucomicrobiota bacterium]HSA09130.1 lipocalin family protein [Candidatus Paceibacterota bacterium]
MTKQTNRSVQSGTFTMLRPVGLFLLGRGLVSSSTTSRGLDAPATAASVDLSRYAGRWYEVARLPTRLQMANEAALAEYGAPAISEARYEPLQVRRPDEKLPEINLQHYER